MRCGSTSAAISCLRKHANAGIVLWQACMPKEPGQGFSRRGGESFSAIVVLMCPVCGSARAAAARDALGGNP